MITNSELIGSIYPSILRAIASECAAIIISYPGLSGDRRDSLGSVSERFASLVILFSLGMILIGRFNVVKNFCELLNTIGD